VNLIFASPTYGPVEAPARNSQFAAIMKATRNGVTWVGPACPEKQKFDVARNQVVRSALDSPDQVDGIFWCDSDIVLPVDAVRIACYGKDFVTGFYYQKSPPYWPLVGARHKTGFTWLTSWPEDVVLAVDGCGFGCVYTSMAMIRKMDVPHFEYNAEVSEDLFFCRKAAELGFQLFADTGVQCGHLPTPEPVTQKHFDSVKDRLHEFITPEWAQKPKDSAA
jgi:hypothetical protein